MGRGSARTKIVTTTIELVERDDGFPSVKQVAEHAGLSRGSVQYHFPTQDVLIDACLDELERRIGVMAAELIRTSTERSGRALVEHAARTLFRFASRERALIGLRLATNDPRGALKGDVHPPLVGQRLAHAETLLAQHVEVDSIDLRIAIKSLAAIVVRLALATESELTLVTGLDDAEEARTACEQYLVRAALRLLCPSGG